MEVAIVILVTTETTVVTMTTLMKHDSENKN